MKVKLKAKYLYYVIFIGLFGWQWISSWEFEIQGLCSRVVDGDTIIVNGQSIRLKGVDAPEKGQLSFDGEDIGEQSYIFLKETIEGQKVSIKYRGRGKYGRIIGEVYFDGININHLLLKKGYALSQYTTDIRYKSLQYNSQLKGLGIFATDGFLRPSGARRLNATK